MPGAALVYLLSSISVPWLGHVQVQEIDHTYFFSSFRIASNLLAARGWRHRHRIKYSRDQQVLMEMDHRTASIIPKFWRRVIILGQCRGRASGAKCRAKSTLLGCFKNAPSCRRPPLAPRSIKPSRPIGRISGNWPMRAVRETRTGPPPNLRQTGGHPVAVRLPHDALYVRTLWRCRARRRREPITRVARGCTPKTWAKPAELVTWSLFRLTFRFVVSK